MSLRNRLDRLEVAAVASVGPPPAIFLPEKSPVPEMPYTPMTEPAASGAVVVVPSGWDSDRVRRWLADRGRQHTFRG